jgi:hypothetical protein
MCRKEKYLKTSQQKCTYESEVVFQTNHCKSNCSHLLCTVFTFGIHYAFIRFFSERIRFCFDYYERVVAYHSIRSSAGHIRFMDKYYLDG